jgi:hypothetical protein
MNEKEKQKIQKLLVLANDASDEESLAKAQDLMLAYEVSEDELFEYKQQQTNQDVIDAVFYSGRPQKWLYRLAAIIAENFRVKTYYVRSSSIDLRFVGIKSDVQIALITFEYARGSIAYPARNYMQQPEIKRKRKRKWQLKQDYIEGYLKGLSIVFRQQVLTNGYDLALQIPEVVIAATKELGLVKGKDMSHKVQDPSAYYSGYQEGVNFRSKKTIGKYS